MPEYLSTRDVAEYLNVEYKTVYRLVRQGKIRTTRIGGVYRILKEDLEAYIKRQTLDFAPPQRPEPEPEASLLKCGACMRLLHDEHDVGGRCAAEGCDMPIGASCWQEGQRYCVTHRPSRVERLQQARKRLGMDKGRLVTALEAKQREKNYVARFDTKVQRITKFWHPLRNEIVSPTQPWKQLHRSLDQAETLMQLLHTGFLDESIEQGMPLNLSSRYSLPNNGGAKPGLVLEVQSVSHLAAFVEQGFDAEPATLEDLTPFLEAATGQAEILQSVYLVAFASSTGWDADAQAYIATGEAGTTFHHQWLLPCLVDLAAMKLIYNHNDERLARLAPLFAPRLPEEEIARVVSYIERALILSSGVSVQEVQLETGVEPHLIQRAFAELVSKGTHRLEEIPGIGPVIIRVT